MLTAATNERPTEAFSHRPMTDAALHSFPRFQRLAYACLVALLAGGNSVAKFGLSRFGVPVYFAEILLGASLLASIPSLRKLRWPIGVVTIFVLLEAARVLYDGAAPGQLVQTAQNFSVIEYMLFAVIGGALFREPAWPEIAKMNLLGGQAAGLIALITFALGSSHSVAITGAHRYLASNQTLAGDAAILTLGVQPDKPLWRKLLLGILPAVSVLMSFQRSSWLACVLGVAAVCLLRPRAREPISGGVSRNKRAERFGLILLVCGVLLALPPVGGLITSTLRQVTGVPLNQDANVAFRVTTQTQELHSWQAHPIDGVGFRSDVYGLDEATGEITAVQGHDGWVTILWRSGIVGLTIYLPLVFAGLALAVRRRIDPWSLWAGGMILTIIVGASFNVWLEAPYVAPILWTLLGSLLAIRPANRKTPQ